MYIYIYVFPLRLSDYTVYHTQNLGQCLGPGNENETMLPVAPIQFKVTILTNSRRQRRMCKQAANEQPEHTER
jgi:hypothetical protein